MANQYAKYKLYKLQRRHQGSSDAFTDVVPQVYSVDGDGTMPLVIAEPLSTECGYYPDITPQYRTIEVDGWICDECE